MHGVLLVICTAALVIAVQEVVEGPLAAEVQHYFLVVPGQHLSMHHSIA